jgi:hypothetical protein
MEAEYSSEIILIYSTLLDAEIYMRKNNPAYTILKSK